MIRITFYVQLLHFKTKHDLKSNEAKQNVKRHSGRISKMYQYQLCKITN